MARLSKSDIAIHQLLEAYNDLNEPQLATFHRVSRKRVRQWQVGEEGPPRAEETTQNVLHQGGFGSGKSYEQRLEEIILSATIPGNEGLIIRKDWEELKNQVVVDLFDHANKWTGDNRAAFMSDPKEVGGSLVITVNTIVDDNMRKYGVEPYPSRIIIKNEPDGPNRKVAEHFKGPEYGWAHYEEVLELREITYRTVNLRVRRPLYRLFTRKMWDAYERPNYKKWFTRTSSHETAMKEGYAEWVLEMSSWKWSTLAVCNPPYRGHWVGDMSEHYQEKERRGLLERQDTLVIKSVPQDNRRMGKAYIDNIKEQLKDDPIALHMHMTGDVGVEVDGIPVYGKQYDPFIHRAHDFRYNPYRPLLVGVDFGYLRPAVVFAQMDDDGAITFIREHLPTQVDATELGRQTIEIIQSSFSDLWSAQTPIVVWGDIAGKQQKDTGNSLAQFGNGSGLMVHTQPLPDFDASLDRVRMLFKQLVGSPVHPRIRVDREGCPMLHEAFQAGYHYKVTHGRRDPKPFKTSNDHYDDVADAARYMICGVVGAEGEVTLQWTAYSKEEIPEFMEALDGQRPEGY